MEHGPKGRQLSACMTLLFGLIFCGWWIVDFGLFIANYYKDVNGEELYRL